MASTGDDQSKQASVTGYPPVPGFSPQQQQYPPQPYPPQYQNYPPPPYYPNPHNNPYPYTAPPPAAYYSQQYAAAPHESSGRFTFVRFILTMMIALFLGAFLLSLLTFLIFGADVPQFFIQSMSVPEFNISGHALRANWDANITISNSNEKLVLFFEKIEGVIVHEETVLALAIAEHINVGTRGETTFNIKFVSATSSNHQEVVMGEHPDLVRDRNKQEVSFALRMMATTTFRSSSLWRRQASLRVFCEELHFKFAGPAGAGTLVAASDRKDHRNECLVYA
ncbi:hypothetical protein HYC85_025319 [Camellia sinensis]|uniref:Late embryogenesis abundant protein LEA-2 subgroup domain-containing protein n=1 Tax=Camellia sinensis TaxID=4442 RepID=A0A7J7GAP1_CAMSI|nr:hypothetical protein HYC85_025319 [Camellia sinensis]